MIWHIDRTTSCIHTRVASSIGIEALAQWLLPFVLASNSVYVKTGEWNIESHLGLLANCSNPFSYIITTFL